MYTSWKKSPVSTVRLLLDIALYGVGALSVLAALLVIGVHIYIHQGFDSESHWPVKLIFKADSHLPLTRVDIHQSAGSQIYMGAQPSSVYLSVVREPKDFIIVGFELAWLVLTFGTFFLIVYLLRKIFIPMDSNEFFDQKTPARLRMLGWVIIVTSLVRSIVTYLYGLYTSSLLNSLPESMRAVMPDLMGRPMVASYIEPIIDLSPRTLFFGLVMFALAIAFQKGLDLKQEQSLTV
jgi:hypothetical protein